MSAASFNGPPNKTFCLQPVGAVCEQSTCVPSGNVTITPCGEHKMLAPNFMSKSLPSRGTGALEEQALIRHLDSQLFCHRPMFQPTRETHYSHCFIT